MPNDHQRSLRRHLGGIYAALDQPAEGPAAEDRIVTVKHLCRSASEALDDNYCREQLDLIELYADDLFSGRHQAWQHGPLSGADGLRHKIRRCLSIIEARLLTLERAKVH